MSKPRIVDITVSITAFGFKVNYFYSNGVKHECEIQRDTTRSKVVQAISKTVNRMQRDERLSKTTGKRGEV